MKIKNELLEISVLCALVAADKCSYDIIIELSECIEISEFDLYRVLTKLEEGGFVRNWQQESYGRARKYYKATTLGKLRLHSISNDIESMRKVSDFIENKLSNII